MIRGIAGEMQLLKCPDSSPELQYLLPPSLDDVGSYRRLNMEVLRSFFGGPAANLTSISHTFSWSLLRPPIEEDDLGTVDDIDIQGPGFMAVNLTIANSTSREEIARRMAADKLAFYGCGINGHMHTSAEWGEQFYRDCDIYGTTSIIIGYEVGLTVEVDLGGPRMPLSRVVIMQSYIDRLIKPSRLVMPS